MKDWCHVYSQLTWSCGRAATLFNAHYKESTSQVRASDTWRQEVKEEISISDLKYRKKFAKSVKKEYWRDIWTEDICFYLDGKCFTYKSNINGQARVPTAKQ